MTDLVVLVPILRRAHRVAPLLESVRSTCDARVLFVCTVDDQAVLDAVDEAGAERMQIPWQSTGDYARKINVGIAATTEPLIFTGADDLAFQPGWLRAARARLRPGIGVVGTNDRCNRRTIRGEHATHMLVTRSYVEQFGTIDEPGKFYHEGYPHEFCDDEAVATAKLRGAFAHARDSIVEHLHPMTGRAPTDELYDGQAARMVLGRPIFEQRRALWT